MRTEGGYEAGNHAWFIGYAPAGRPKIAFAVMVEHGGHGGDVAAPIAMEIVRNTFDTVMPADREAPKVGRAVRRAARAADAANAASVARAAAPKGDATAPAATAEEPTP